MGVFSQNLTIWEKRILSRFNQEHIRLWNQDGVVVIEKFFKSNEISTTLKNYKSLYGEEGLPQPRLAALEKTEYGEQFKNIDTLPYAASIEMDLISLHPELINLAKSLISVESVHMYQSHTWAKFTGHTNYDQGYHCDFGNHTLTVPSTELMSKTVNFLIYVSDVTADLGPFEYVPKTHTDLILGNRSITIPVDEYDVIQAKLQSSSQSVVAPAGSLIAYGLEVFHRGTNLVKPYGARYSMTVSYKQAGNDSIGFHVWQADKNRDWSLIFEHCTPEQLNCLGVPLPGSKFWNKTTISQTKKRWANWDSSAYEAHLA